jgi:hypothetical protein
MSGKNKISALLSVVLLALSLVLAFGVKYVFHSCPVSMEKGAMIMPCHWAEQAIFATGIALAVMSVLLFVFRKAGERAALSTAMLPVTIMAMLFPQIIIKICMMPDMHCRTTMRPAVIAVTAVLLVVEVINIVINLKEAKNEK